MRDVAIVGAGMTRFGKYLDRSMKDLAREAVESALQGAGIEARTLEAAVVGNAMAGLVTGQECIRGQVVLREMGIGGIPVVNTENACAVGARVVGVNVKRNGCFNSWIPNLRFTSLRFIRHVRPV